VRSFKACGGDGKRCARVCQRAGEFLGAWMQ